MSAERPIHAGDLVVVVKPTPCCGDVGEIGHTFTVTSLARMATFCLVSGRPSVEIMAFGHPTGPTYLSILKRIDPLPADEKTSTSDRVNA
jgi:hypothetical protein